MGKKYSTFSIRERAIKALRRGLGIIKTADAYGIDRTTLFRWKRSFDLNGTRGLERKPGSGRRRKLPDLGKKFLRGIILKGASRFGFETDLWTIRELHIVIKKYFGEKISKDTIWRRLKEAGLSYKKPERQYFEINKKERLRWVKTEVPKILQCVKKHSGILYFQDESHISLTANLGKTWGLKGKKSIVKVTSKRGGFSAMSAISRRGHLLFSLHEKRITSNEIIQFLKQMLIFHKYRHLIVVMDNAPPHISRKTKTFIDSQKRLHVFYLPKYSPDWNPDEKVWNHLKNQKLKGHQAKSKKEMKVLARSKLRSMAKDPRLIKGIFFRCCVANLFR
jgi:transposase